MSLSPLPLVSVITPSYNQGKFIRETIDSILSQDYPHLEHIVVDGGSTDQTLSILQEYAQRDPRFRFISEPDNGQSHAINKGLSMARGEIIGWLNSDDTYLPGAIRKAVHAFQQHPAWGMLHGRGQVIDESGTAYSAYPSEKADARSLYQSCVICQPTAFIRTHVFRQMGGVDERLQFCMDYELWMRISKAYPIGFVAEFLASARIHGACKSATQWHSVGVPEVLKSLAKNYSSIPPGWVSYLPQYRGMGVIDLLRQLKTLRSNSSRITGMNRYRDLWAPPILRITMESDPAAPAQFLLVKGKIPGVPMQLPKAFTLTALVNGMMAKSFTVSKALFALEIPLDPRSLTHRIDISSTSTNTPALPQIDNMRVGGYMAEDVLPLSHEEAIVYRAFRN
ncbi:glycosyltransferase [Brevibacillus choshinensis]|uniref:Glycosyltransferase n=1 Tax=Brevibacillus choshinensis TaxID=54911 RepID=A0ABX7FSW7_BRECH|nr:glycosyltransferase [Brevibacillus choshinensis]